MLKLPLSLPETFLFFVVAGMLEHKRFAFKGTNTKTAHFGSYPKSDNFNKLYKITCQVF